MFTFLLISIRGTNNNNNNNNNNNLIIILILIIIIILLLYYYYNNIIITVFPLQGGSSSVKIYINFYFLLFGRGPNRVMETACFDANVQYARNTC